MSAIGLIRPTLTDRGARMNKSLIGEDFRFDIPALTPGAPSTLSPQFITLFHAIEASCAPGRPLAVLFAAAGDEAATTPLASGFARVAARALDLPVLFLDATGRVEDADGIAPSPGRRGSPRAATLSAPLAATLPTHDRHVAWNSLGPAPVLLAGGEAERLLDAARADYPFTIIDGGASPPESLSRHADGVVLVARAGRTGLDALHAARRTVERGGGRLLGAVLDDEAVTLPRWLASRL